MKPPSSGWQLTRTRQTHHLGETERNTGNGPSHCTTMVWNIDGMCNKPLKPRIHSSNFSSLRYPLYISLTVLELLWTLQGCAAKLGVSGWILGPISSFSLLGLNKIIVSMMVVFPELYFWEKGNILLVVYPVTSHWPGDFKGMHWVLEQPTDNPWTYGPTKFMATGKHAKETAERIRCLVQINSYASSMFVGNSPFLAFG